ncbi:C40 family peptidase [Leuconostoc pseudomesenteroides]|uniref:C40 family peptidase n=1 Tax=Leuconostoc pseudomesenteroides TaxID=33968 RepID=UPI001B8BC9CD|nr:C40 family peptidase [Leuconostoc pseudomesenteroides]MBS0957109.1 C40 family peptidase [Leuconostoc pseudomesenteroides]
MERLDKKIIASGLGVLGLVGVGSSIVNADQVKNAVDKAVSSVAEATGLVHTNEVSLSKTNLTIPKDKVLHVNTPAETKAAQTNTIKKTTTYRVKAGDSLWSIAQAHKVSVDTLVANNNNSDLISAGQILTLPTDESVSQNARSVVPEVVSTTSTGTSSDSSLDTSLSSADVASPANEASTGTTTDLTSTVAAVASKPATSDASVSSAAAVTSAVSAASSTAPVTDVASSANVPTPVTSSSANVPVASTVSEASQESATSATPSSSASSAASATQGSSSSSTAPQPEQSETTTPAANQNVIAASAAIVSLAKQLATQNIPYVWGGATPQTGFDCSGLVSYVFQNAAGISLPHSSVAQESYTKTEAVSQAQPGDLLFWGTKGASYHVAIYIGGNQYVAAPQPGMNVRVETISANFMPSFAGSVQ